MRILVISDISPYPLVSGDRIREYNLLRRMADQHEVWLATLLENPDDEAGTVHLASFCVGVEYAHSERHHPLVHVPGLLKYGLTGKPLELKFRYSAKLARKIQRLAAEIDFDIVMIINSHTAPYLEVLPPSSHRKSILNLENIEFAQYESIYQIERKPINKIRAWINYQMMRRWEPRYAGRFDHCVTVSENDRSVLLDSNPSLKIDVIPNGVDIRQYQPLLFQQGNVNLLFIGKMSYAPCSDAAVYFCGEILPLIRKQLENVELWIVGREPPQEVVNLGTDRVHVTGWVEEVVPYYERSAVCVVPLRAGGGTRLKILEAMALGRPVVSSKIGCEGLDVIDGENILIAERPEEFAEKTVRLLRDDNLRKSIAENARRLVENQYDWDILAQRLIDILNRIV